jgi:serine/threonine protein kinase
MARRRTQPCRTTPRRVRLSGRSYCVLREESVYGHPFLILDSLGNCERERYLAYDPHSRFAYRLCVLPRSSEGEQHLTTLFRSQRTNDSFSRIHCWDERPKSFVVVHDWIPGNDLDEYLQQVRAKTLPPISPREAVRFVRGMAHGLGWLHEHARIVHGDLKPENLVLNSNADRMIAVDFGSAWPLERTTKRELGDGVDSRYAAPELQGATGVIDGRVDQFSLSVILYEMLTGRLPYQWGGKAGRPQFAETMLPNYIPPSRIAPNCERTPDSVWQLLDSVVTTGVAFHPDHRFATDAQWCDALEVVWRAIDPRPAVIAIPSPAPQPTGVLGRLQSLFRGR